MELRNRMEKRLDALENKLLEKGDSSKTDRNVILADEHCSPENGYEICDAWIKLEVLTFSGGQQLEVLKSNFTIEEIMPSSSDLIQKQDTSLEVHEECFDALPTAVDDASTGCRPASVNKVRKKVLKPIKNDDKISDTKSDDYSSIQIAKKNNEFKDELEASPERVPLGHLRKKLLILDINGLLADIHSRTPKGYKADKRIAKKAGKHGVLIVKTSHKVQTFFQHSIQSICVTQI